MNEYTVFFSAPELEPNSMGPAGHVQDIRWGRVLLIWSDAVGVFYCLSQLGWIRIKDRKLGTDRKCNLARMKRGDLFIKIKNPLFEMLWLFCLRETQRRGTAMIDTTLQYTYTDPCFFFFFFFDRSSIKSQF